MYDSAHLGHARTYILFDTIRRVLRETFNKEVIFAMNITDVDDKILKRSKDLKISAKTLARKYENEFFEDLYILGVEKPTITPRATNYIPEMIQFLGKLKDFTYSTSDGSLYLDTKKANEFVDYPGQLGHGMHITGEESASSTIEKRNLADFALWKGRNENQEELNWDASPTCGIGRPGWHLECSVMIDSTLGKIQGDGTIDIHGGGIDLCFPHHANERLQSQLALLQRQNSSYHNPKDKKEWSSIFCHTGHLTLGDTKMSKSLGNSSTIRQVFESKKLTPRQLRLLFLSLTKYSANMEWNEGSIERVKALDNLFEDVLSTQYASEKNIHQAKEEFTEEDIAFVRNISGIRQSILEAFADDFDFPAVFDQLQKLSKELKRRKTLPRNNVGLDKNAETLLLSTLEVMGFGGVSGVKPCYGYSKTAPSTTLANENDILDLLVRFRSKIREAAKSGDLKAVLKECDLLRNENPFVSITDSKDGSSLWKRKQPLV